MNCQKCNSDKIVSIDAHSKDMNSYKFHWLDFEVEDDYLPIIPGLCGTDDLSIEFCMDCGQLQGTWPKELDEDYVEDVIENEDNYEEMISQTSKPKEYDPDYNLFMTGNRKENIARKEYYDQQLQYYIDKGINLYESGQKAEQDLLHAIS